MYLRLWEDAEKQKMEHNFNDFLRILMSVWYVRSRTL